MKNDHDRRKVSSLPINCSLAHNPWFSRLSARLLCPGGARPATVSPVGSVGAEQCAKKAMAFCALHPERSGESCHGFAVTEGILTSDSMPLSACDYPFHRSRLSARLLCPGGARPATTEATAENSSHQRPTGTRSPFGGPRRLQSGLLPLYK